MSRGVAMTVEVLVTTHVMGLDRVPEDAWPLALPGAPLRVRDLIRAKVTCEVAEYAAGRRRMVGKEYLSLDELAAFQATAGRGRAMVLEVEAEVRRAWTAFEEGDYIVTVGAREVHDLDAMVSLEPGARIQFLRLLPVAGGVGRGSCRSDEFPTMTNACGRPLLDPMAPITRSADDQTGTPVAPSPAASAPGPAGFFA